MVALYLLTSLAVTPSSLITVRFSALSDAAETDLTTLCFSLSGVLSLRFLGRGRLLASVSGRERCKTEGEEAEAKVEEEEELDREGAGGGTTEKEGDGEGEEGNGMKGEVDGEEEEEDEVEEEEEEDDDDEDEDDAPALRCATLRSERRPLADESRDADSRCSLSRL
jgi:hypothetical protein